MRSSYLMRLAAFVVLDALASIARAQQPAANAVVGLDPVFEWADSPEFTQYLLLVRPAGGATPQYFVVAGDDPAACPDGITCSLAAGHPWYPQLTPGSYEWQNYALSSVTGRFRQWSPAGWSAFRIAIPAPTLDAEWIGENVRLRWSPVPAAANYSAVLRHEAFAPSTVKSGCTTGPCEETVSAAHIPYGTIRVEFSSCGSNGQCSETPAVAVLTRNCPATPATPVILAPQPNAVSAGFLALQFANVAYAERFRIRVRRNDAPATVVVDEEVGLSQLQCKDNTCMRVLPLVSGKYTTSLSAACANAWSTNAQRNFEISTAQATPTILTPSMAQTTSVYPLIAWLRLAQIDRYEVTTTNVATQEVQKAIVDCPIEQICALDTLQANFKPLIGAHDVSVRVAMLAMPNATVRFNPTPAYKPPQAEIASPEEGENVPWPVNLLLSFRVDPQVPLFTTRVAGPGAFNASGYFNRTRPECSLEPGPPMKLLCTTSVTLTSSGSHYLYVQTQAPTDNPGQLLVNEDDAQRNFTRMTNLTQGPKAAYTIYAQNTQFLPPSPFNGSASSAYGLSERERARRLADYILANEFDVVALSELFMFPPKEILNQKLGGYNFVSNIDTQGRVSVGTIATIGIGYGAGWWVNAANAGAAIGWGKNFSDWFKEANSGLAIYSRFPIVEYSDTADDNSRCTDDKFNELAEDHPGFEAGFSINRRVRFRQYCHGTGTDDLSAKGFAAVQLKNTRTGLPLWIMWSHTQAYTGGTAFAGRPDGNYTDSYKARATQVEDNAGPAMEYVMQLTPNFDAFVLGDWNIPQPPSVSNVPRKHEAVNAQNDGWPDLSLLYGAPPSTDPRTPLFSSLVGEHAPGPNDRLFDQYWAYFDPRNPRRTFGRFTDLWLFNPAGDPGYTLEPGRNPVATCLEIGEPCHDRGARYDTVLAKFHAWNWTGGITYSDVPRDPVRDPAWDEQRSCVLHTRRALDFALSDHWGTIIEVGPSAPYCSPNTAKADPHKWRTPENAPAKPVGFDDAAGRHLGMFRYGGANEWFYFSKAGSIDIVAVKLAASFQGLAIEAYDARDLSVRLQAGAEQNPQQILSETCSEAWAAVGRLGAIPENCATASRRLTYTNDGPFFVRIRPVKDGKVCNTCSGDYEVLFRERFCLKHWEAIPVKPKLPGSQPTTAGWFGATGDSACWFSFDLAMPSPQATPQTLGIEKLYALNTQFCEEFIGNAGNCGTKYEVQFFDSSPPPSDSAPPAEPTMKLVDHPFTFTASSDSEAIPTSAAWFTPSTTMPTGVMEKSQKRTFYALMKRSGGSAAQRVGLPWTTNLRTVTYNTVTTSDIEDDIEIEIEICLPLLGCVIRGISDPFEKEDEIYASLWIDGQWTDGGHGTLNIDNAGSDTFRFPNRAPGMSKNCEGYTYGWCGNGSYKVDLGRSEVGTTVSYTDYSQVIIMEKDGPTSDDTVISDMFNCDWPGTPAPHVNSWQASEYQRAWDELLKGSPPNLKSPMRFSDDCPDSDPQFNYFLKATVSALP